MSQQDHETSWQAATLALQYFPEISSNNLELINVSENVTFKVSDDSGVPTHALRVHRTGYHSLIEILSELAWISSIANDTDVSVPQVVRNAKNRYVTEVVIEEGDTRYCVATRFVEGVELTDEDSTERFYSLGIIAAKLHLHTLQWSKPSWFVRFNWDLSDAFGTSPRWGPWSSQLDTIDRKYLDVVERSISSSLQQYGRTKDRFGLIHADMRLSNVIWSTSNLYPTVIDFDDCGYGWFLYDLATTVSFFEHKERVPEMVAKWVKGYESVRSLSPEDKEIIWPLIMFRRLLLLGWIQSHPHVPISRQLSPTFVQDTLSLADRYNRNDLATFATS